MPRLVQLPLPLRGLITVRPPALVGAQEAHRLENAVLTDSSVVRRKGRFAAYAWPTAVTGAATMLARFYNYATTGTVTKKFLIAYNALLYAADADFSDDAPVTLTAFTLQNLPQESRTTLYTGYDAASSVSYTSGALKNSAQSRSWLYLYPEFASGDDTSKVTNVPLRTQADGEMYLHGLVPPAGLVQADVTEDDGYAAGIKWAAVEVSDDIDFSTRAQSRMVEDEGGNLWMSFVAVSDGFLYVGKIDTSGSWTAEKVNGNLSVDTSFGYRYSTSLAIGPEGSPHVVFIEATSGDLTHVWKELSGAAWQQENIAAASAHESVAMAIDSEGIVHVAARTATAGLEYYRKENGTWGAAENVGVGATGSDHGRYVDVAIDNEKRPVIVFSSFDTAGGTHYHANWALRTAAATFTQETILSDDYGQGIAIAIDSDGESWCSFYQSVDGIAPFHLWYGNRTAPNTWTTAEISTDGGGGSTAIAITADNNIIISYDSTKGSGIAYTQDGGSNWELGSLPSEFDPDPWSGIMSPSKNNYYQFAVTTDDRGILYTGQASVYQYRLTAEYDDLVLGESGPSVNFQLPFSRTIGYGSSVVNIALANPATANYYDMTLDVTRINIYRTVRYGTDLGPYYKVGSVDCTGGAPDSDFVDSIIDVDLLLENQLDQDKFMPPKYRTAVVWKDHLVIANLKARKTDAAEGTELDLEADGIHKNRVRFSIGFEPDNFRANFYQDLIPDSDAGPIRKLVVNHSNDYLFALMENGCMALTDPTGDLATSLSFRAQSVANSRGTPAPESAVYIDGRIFYWTKWGIEVIQGFQAVDLTSQTIGNLWNMMDASHKRYADRINMSQIALVRGVADPNTDRIYWAYPSATATANDRVLVFDLRRGAFSIFTNLEISCFARWDGEGDRGQLFGGEATASLGAWTYRLDFGNFDHIGLAPPVQAPVVDTFPSMHVWPGVGDVGSAYLKKWRRLWLEAVGDSEQSVQMRIDIDNVKGTSTLDTFSWVPGASDDMPRREVRNIPRSLIGVRGAPRVIVDQGTGIANIRPFEIYSWSVEVEDLRTRHRGERNT